jgi:hypothetical protein
MITQTQHHFDNLASVNSDAAREFILLVRAIDELTSTTSGAELFESDPALATSRLLAKIRLATYKGDPVETMRRLKMLTGLSAAQIAAEMRLPRTLIISLLAGNPKARVYDRRTFMLRAEAILHLFNLEGFEPRSTRRDGTLMYFDARRAVAI